MKATDRRIKAWEIIGFSYAVMGGVLISLIFDYFLGSQIWTTLAWLCAYILWIRYVQGVISRHQDSLREDIKLLERLPK